MITRYEELDEFIPVHTTITQEINGDKRFRVTKKEKLMQPLSN